MTSVQLRRRVLDRYVRPYAFGMSIATFVVSVALLKDWFFVALLRDWPGDALALMGIATVGLLWGGWWLRSDRAMVRGLLLSTGVWAGVGFTLSWGAVDADPLTWVFAALSWCWALISSISWWLEYDDLRRRDGR